MSDEPFCLISIHFEEQTNCVEKVTKLEDFILVTSDFVHEKRLLQINPQCPFPNYRDSEISKLINLNVINQLHDTSCIILDGRVFSALIYLLTVNANFRNAFLLKINNPIDNFQKSVNISYVKARLVMPEKCEIGYKSLSLALKILWERIELDDAMHWLSTLGGAYSNLGEHSLSFAHRACENALRQMKIALKSDDPFVIYRCWLYVAMSLMQQGKLSSSRRIIEAVYRKFSTLDKMNHRTEDEKILKMCLGIWARLMHVWNSRKRKLA